MGEWTNPLSLTIKEAMAAMLDMNAEQLVLKINDGETIAIFACDELAKALVEFMAAWDAKTENEDGD